MTLTIPASLIKTFKKKAMASNKELLVFLVGKVIKENEQITEVVVEEAIYPPQRSSNRSVEDLWSVNDVVRLQVKILPLQIVGTIHSHPNCEPHLSKADIEGAAKIGEAIFGVLSWWKNGARRRSDLTFYSGAKTVTYDIIDG